MSQKLCFILLIINTIVLVFLFQTFSFLFTSKAFNPKHYFKELCHYTPKEIANIPESYFKERIEKEFNNTCALYPTIFDLNVHNNYWQQQATSNGTFNFFNAYLDFRTSPPMVRILATFDKKDKNKTIFCQLWYSNKEPVVVQTEPLVWIFRDKWGADSGNFHHPYLISCPLSNEQVPISVSLVEKFCDNATNNLKIFDNREPRKDFVVCVKGLSFPLEDKSIRLIEWIELLFILGADKINFYEFSVHPRTKKVLNYYEEKRSVEVTPITLVGEVSNTPQLQKVFLRNEVIMRRLQEVIAYNDCLYKHVNSYKYVILLDIDEVIFPAKNTWLEMIKILESADKQKSSYLAQNVYFFDTLNETEYFQDIPQYMHMLQHVYRSRIYTEESSYVKGFHKTDEVVTLHNHYPISCFEDCNSASINVNVAHLQHYRSDCVLELRSQCESMRQKNVMDTRIWSFKAKLVRKTQEVMKYLRFMD